MLPRAGLEEDVVLAPTCSYTPCYIPVTTPKQERSAVSIIRVSPYTHWLRQLTLLHCPFLMGVSLEAVSGIEAGLGAWLREESPPPHAQVG